MILILQVIDINNDSDDIQPSNFCDGCYAVLSRKVKSLEDSTPYYIHSLTLFPCIEHSSHVQLSNMQKTSCDVKK